MGCLLELQSDQHKRRRVRGQCLGSACLALFFCLAGCTGDRSTVSGTVTLDGVPIACGERMNGTVSFSRTNGGGAPAIGFIDGSGQYSVKTGASTGLEPGSYLVAISVNKITIPADPNAMPIPTAMVPKKYSSTVSSNLSADVKPGSNTFDFSLVSDGGT